MRDRPSKIAIPYGLVLPLWVPSLKRRNFGTASGSADPGTSTVMVSH